MVRALVLVGVVSWRLGGMIGLVDDLQPRFVLCDLLMLLLSESDVC